MDTKESNGSSYRATDIPFWRQLRWNLVIYFVLLVVLPMASVTGILINRTTQQTTRDVTDQLESVSQLKIDQIRNWLTSAQGTLDLTAVEPNAAKFGALLLASDEDESFAQKQGEINDLMKDAAASQKFFKSFILYTSEGEIVAASDETDVGKIVKNRPYYRDSLEGDSIQPPYYTLATGELAMVATQPVFDEQGDIIGVLAGQFDLGFLDAIMSQRAGLGETGETYLVSVESNYLLTSSQFEEAGYIARQAYHSQGIDNALDGEDGSGVYDDYRDPPVQVVGVYRWVPELQAALLAEQDVSEALAAATTTRNFMIGVAGGFALLAAAIGLYVATRVSDPVDRLTETASSVAAGDLTARAEVDVENEVGVLAETFNAMVERISSLLNDVQKRSAALEARTREIEASQSVTFAASARTSPDQLLNMVVNLIRDQFHLYHVQVYIVDSSYSSSSNGKGTEKEVAMLRQATGYAGRRLLQSGHHIPLEDSSLVTEAIHSGDVVVVDDVEESEQFISNPLLPDTQSELVVPLKAGDEVIGVLDIQDRESERFTSHLVSLFRAMADQIAFLFENSELVERVTEQTQAMADFTAQLRAASEIARRTSTILDPDRMLQQAVELMQSRFGLYHVHIYVLDGDDEDGRLGIRAGSGEVGRVLRERGHTISVREKKSPVARAVREQDIVLVEDTSLESDFKPNPLLPQTRSELAVPLIVGDEILGVLDVQDDQANRFGSAERDTFNTLAGQIATALQNAAYVEEIEQAAERLREMDRLKSEFLANMSHELRTPLNSIIGYAELMLMGISKMDPETVEDVQAIYDNGKHLLNLVNDILDMSKIEAGRLTLNVEQVQIEPLVERVSTTVFEQLDDRPIEWSVQVDDNLPLIQADPMRVEQIIRNLLSNAVKFTREGAIDLRVWRENGSIRIEVQDTGIGIAARDMDKVFDRFQQVDGSSTRSAEGSGLGLAITRHLVKLHGGTIEVESQPGEGSTFTVCLPVNE